MDSIEAPNNDLTRYEHNDTSPHGLPNITLIDQAYQLRNHVDIIYPKVLSPAELLQLTTDPGLQTIVRYFKQRNLIGDGDHSDNPHALFLRNRPMGSTNTEKYARPSRLPPIYNHFHSGR